MEYNYDSSSNDLDKLKKECMKMMRCHVILNLEDSCMVDGIIEDLDDESVTILIGEDVYEEEEESSRKRYIGRPRRRYRRYRRRRRFPLRGIRRLLVYPYLYYPY